MANVLEAVVEAVVTAFELNAEKTISKGVFGFNIQFEFEKDKIL